MQTSTGSSGRPSIGSLVELHRSSWTRNVSATIDGWLLPVSSRDAPVQYDVRTTPGPRWRIDRAGVTLYVRNGNDAYCRKDDEMYQVEPSTRQMAALHPVNPLWFFTESSMLSKWANDAPPTAVVAEPVRIDGRTGWPIHSTGITVGTQGDDLLFVVDEKTGVVLQIASSSGRLGGRVRDLHFDESFDDETFAWAGDVATSPDEDDGPIAADRITVGRTVAYLGEERPYGHVPGARFRTLHHGHPGRVMKVSEGTVVVEWFLFEEAPMRFSLTDGKSPSETGIAQLTEISFAEEGRRSKNIAHALPPKGTPSGGNS